MLSDLQGYRTYLTALAIGILAAVHYLGYIDANIYATLLAILGAGAAASLRAAIDNKI